jgi:hypothetical protein
MLLIINEMYAYIHAEIFKPRKACGAICLHPRCTILGSYLTFASPENGGQDAVQVISPL